MNPKLPERDGRSFVNFEQLVETISSLLYAVAHPNEHVQVRARRNLRRLLGAITDDIDTIGVWRCAALYGATVERLRSSKLDRPVELNRLRQVLLDGFNRELRNAKRMLAMLMIDVF